MERKPLKSILLASMGYDKATQTLEVEYRKSGTVYRYANVPPEKFKEMISDESLGSYFLKFIKPNHPFTRIEDEKKEGKDAAPPPSPQAA